MQRCVFADVGEKLVEEVGGEGMDGGLHAEGAEKIDAVGDYLVAEMGAAVAAGGEKIVAPEVGSVGCCVGRRVEGRDGWEGQVWPEEE